MPAFVAMMGFEISVKSLLMITQSIPRKWIDACFGGSAGVTLRGQMISKRSLPSPNMVLRYQAASRLLFSVAACCRSGSRRRYRRRVLEIDRFPWRQEAVHGKFTVLVFRRGCWKRLYFPTAETLERVGEEHRSMGAVIPVSAALLPSAVLIDLIEHLCDAVIGFRDHIHELGVLGEERERGETKPRIIDAAPVATVGNRPPVVLVIPAHAGDRLFKERPADTARCPFSRPV